MAVRWVALRAQNGDRDRRRRVQSPLDFKAIAKACAPARDDLPSSRLRVTRVRLSFEWSQLRWRQFLVARSAAANDTRGFASCWRPIRCPDGRMEPESAMLEVTENYRSARRLDVDRQEDMVTGRGTRARYQGFITGANPDGYELKSIQVEIDRDFTGATADVTAELWTSHSGDPGASLIPLNKPGTITAGTNSFTAPAGLFLDRNTTYYLAIGSSGDTLHVSRTEPTGGRRRRAARLEHPRHPQAGPDGRRRRRLLELRQLPEAAHQRHGGARASSRRQDRRPVERTCRCPARRPGADRHPDLPDSQGPRGPDAAAVRALRVIAGPRAGPGRRRDACWRSPACARRWTRGGSPCGRTGRARPRSRRPCGPPGSRTGTRVRAP